MDERANLPVGLPHPNPTKSYWQNSLSDIANHRTTAELPSSVDYVIVGSGISGCSIAYNLLLLQPGASVILLEARQACSGATGRNGGHTKAASYRSFLDHESEYGIDEAVKIAKLEYDNIRATHAFARQHDIKCASTECDTIDIIYHQKQLDSGLQAIRRMREAISSHPAAQYEVFDAKDTERRFLTPGALGSFQYAAGSISAYDFTTGILRLALEKSLNLQTNTPVGKLTRSSSGWIIKTLRGEVRATKVVIATNGYTAQLLPQMQGLIVPLHGQIAAQRPGLALPPLNQTYSFIYETGYEYMITRPSDVPNPGDIIIGGGLHQLPHSGASRYGNTDDSSLEPTITEYLRRCTATAFADKWGADHSLGRIKQEWSGIMGATADGLPYVGAVPNTEGLYISAGFNGHGMVLCLKAAEALTDMLADNTIPDWFPQSMLVTNQRLHARFTGRKDLKAPEEAQFGER